MERMTQEEIDELLEAHKKAVLEGTANTEAWADAINDAKIGIKGYTAALRDAQKQIKTSLVGLGKSIADGEVGSSIFNEGIKAGADRLDLFFIKKLGPAGAVLGGFTKAAAAYVGAVNKQADALYKSYQDISRTGTIGFGAMTQVYQNMQQFGYGIKELDKFGALMAENSQNLARFGGNAVDGAKAFAGLADELQHSPITEKLLNMGMSVDEINRSAAGFVKQQTMLGRNQRDIGDKLASGSLHYIDQLETISRLTGKSRKEQEENIKNAMAEQAFNARYSQLTRQAQSKDEATRKSAERELEKLDVINQTLTGDLRKEAIRGIGGDMSAFKTSINLAGGEFVDALTNPAKDANDVIKSLVTGFDQLNESGGEQLAMMNAWNGTFPDYMQTQELAAQFRGKNIKDELAKAKANKEAADSTTKNMTAAQIAERKARDNIQDFINFGIDPVQKVMSILAKALEYLTDLLPGAGKAREQYEAEKRAAKPPKMVGVWNKENKMVYVSPEEAAKIKGGEMEAPKESTVEGAPGAGAEAPSPAPSNAPANVKKYMQATALLESGGRADAKAGTSSAGGMFQFLDSTWMETVKAMGKNYTLQDKFDPAKSAEVMEFFTMRQKSQLEKGIGKEASSTDLYMSHFLGAGGATKFINALQKDPNAIAADMDPAAAKANQAIYYDKSGRARTLQEVYNLMGSKISSVESAVESGKWGGKDLPSTVAALGGPTSGYKTAMTDTAEKQPRASLSAPKLAEVKQVQNEDEATALMAEQVAKMNDIVRVMEKQTALTGKILQRSTV